MILRTQKDAREGTVRVHCSAEGIYPEPNMTISSRERFDEDDNVRIDIETRNKDGLYNVTATMELDDRGDGNPLTFDCILRIPDANYTVHKSIIYYPIRTTTTTTTTTTPRPPPPVNRRTSTPGSVFNRTVRTHYLDPDLFRGKKQTPSTKHRLPVPSPLCRTL
ncbi:Hypothetical protein NTJ_01730 [Nesidiocoris tenuis]|uniref:Immunoglobulin I-set domain-containing protein n=1 Tax=Nesidiocoris tenuis TaxID=355587 RepID=A0ABN7A9D5_9HEMI|nr:Hypothetical protein NTJ_01730 [Nesidiocoris tenuis]